MANGSEATVGPGFPSGYPCIQHRQRPAEDGEPYHPKGSGNGYLLTFGGLRVYVAGDTEDTPEMKALKDIDVAFLPMNLPYTMTPEPWWPRPPVPFSPRILYPYHFGDTDPNAAGSPSCRRGRGVEVRIRDMS